MAGKKKLSKKELANLQTVIATNNSINQNRANICLEKESAIRNIKSQFNEQWELLDLNSQQAQRDQQNYIAELTLKYGKSKQFDLDTGEIKNQ